MLFERQQSVLQQITIVNIALVCQTELAYWIITIGLQESAVAHQSAPGVQIENNKRESSDRNNTCVGRSAHIVYETQQTYKTGTGTPKANSSCSLESNYFLQPDKFNSESCVLVAKYFWTPRSKRCHRAGWAANAWTGVAFLPLEKTGEVETETKEKV